MSFRLIYNVQNVFGILEKSITLIKYNGYLNDISLLIFFHNDLIIPPLY